jgi:hypothetical protein
LPRPAAPPVPLRKGVGEKFFAFRQLFSFLTQKIFTFALVNRNVHIISVQFAQKKSA